MTRPAFLIALNQIADNYLAKIDAEQTDDAKANVGR
jgi:hypothetical protein